MIFTDFDTSNKYNCTIISTSLTTLTTDGGVLADGTQNVTIYCLCMESNVVVGGARWFFPNGTQVRTETHRLTGPNDPYYRNIIPAPLFIPEFVHPYDGTYSCGPSSNFVDVKTEGDTINLTLLGINNTVHSPASTCTITPLNPTTLTATGGVLPDGIENVIINCDCVSVDSATINSIRWFNANGSRILIKQNTPAGAPYFIVNPLGSITTLVIPIFNESYDGLYTCGDGNEFSRLSVMSTINITVQSKIDN